MIEKLRAVPMIHVADVRATVDWYTGIGFTVNYTYNDGGDGLSFASLSFGGGEVMFNSGGQPSAERRREVDLYVYTEKVDELYERLKDRAEVVKAPHDTFYGMRELIIRDLNRFWITFGELSAFQVLMAGVREGKVELVQRSLESGRLQLEALSVALAAATSEGRRYPEIETLLKENGAVPPLEISLELLQSYAGKYRSGGGFEVAVTAQNGRLSATPSGQAALLLAAVDKATFRPVAMDLGKITFILDAGRVTSCEIKEAAHTMLLRRVDET